MVSLEFTEEVQIPADGRIGVDLIKIVVGDVYRLHLPSSRISQACS